MTSAPARKTFQFDLHSKRQNIHLKKTCNMKTGKVGLMFPSLKKKKKGFIIYLRGREITHSRMGRGAKGERESQEDSALNTELDKGLYLRALRSGCGPKSRVRCFTNCAKVLPGDWYFLT